MTAGTGSQAALPAAARHVQDELTRRGLDDRVMVMPDSTRTAAEAAAACGCTIEQIAKSIVFRAVVSDQPVLVITSGANRVDEKLLADALGESVGKADADFVRRRTGFAIGGVAPVGHAEPVRIFIDQALLDYDEIWAAAGTPRAVFRLTPDELRSLTDGTVIRVA